MIFEEKTIILKDGRTAILKSPCVEDAEKLLNYIKKSCSETDFLARYSDIITPKMLRHYFCSHALDTGDYKIHEVANQAGHSNVQTTLI